MTINEIESWKHYLDWIAEENKKIELRNKKKLKNIETKRIKDLELSRIYEADFKSKMDRREKRVARMIKNKEIDNYLDIIGIPFPRYHNPYRWVIYLPSLEPKLEPKYEDFLTMIAKGKL